MKKNKFGHIYEIKNKITENKITEIVLNPYEKEWKPKWQINSKINYLKALLILDYIGIKEIECVKVIHCPQAYGVVLTLKTLERTPVLTIPPHTDSPQSLTLPLSPPSSSSATTSSEYEQDDKNDKIDIIVNNKIENKIEISKIENNKTPVKQKNKNLKIVYSGDTRPSKLLAEIGKDCSLLIHEATFEDDELGW